MIRHTENMYQWLMQNKYCMDYIFVPEFSTLIKISQPVSCPGEMSLFGNLVRSGHVYMIQLIEDY